MEGECIKCQERLDLCRCGKTMGEILPKYKLNELKAEIYDTLMWIASEEEKLK